MLAPVKSGPGSTGEQLLHEIRRRPADNTIRLAYADWLDEAGLDPWHARLIRLQVGRYEGRPDVMGSVAEVAAEINAILGGPGMVLRRNQYGPPAPHHHVARGFRWAVQCHSVPEALGQDTADLVSSAPITHVKVASLSPIYVALPGGIRGWEWEYRRHGDVGGNLIPRQAAAFMPLRYPPRVGGTPDGTIVWRYHTSYDAEDAISQALADWLRAGAWYPVGSA